MDFQDRPEAYRGPLLRAPFRFRRACRVPPISLSPSSPPRHPFPCPRWFWHVLASNTSIPGGIPPSKWLAATSVALTPHPSPRHRCSSRSPPCDETQATHSLNAISDVFPILVSCLPATDHSTYTPHLSPPGGGGRYTGHHPHPLVATKAFLSLLVGVLETHTFHTETTARRPTLGSEHLVKAAV